MRNNLKRLGRLSLLSLLITALFLGSSCGAPQNVWSVKMESIYSKEILELKLRAQVYDGTPGDGLIVFVPKNPTTLEGFKQIAEEDKRVKAEIVRDGLLISKENEPDQFDYFYITKVVNSQWSEHAYWLTNLKVRYRLSSENLPKSIMLKLLMPMYIFITDESVAGEYGNVYQRALDENTLYPIHQEYSIGYLFNFFKRSGFIEVNKYGDSIHITQIPGYSEGKEVVSTNILEVSIIERDGEKYLKVTTVA